MVDPARLPTSFEGVPLAQLAHVAAARAEGFSLEQILDAEGLAAEVFRAADVACKATLCDADAGPRLFAAYEIELARAEERLGRRVRPLDEDLGAWIQFLAAYAASKAPLGMLDALGLSLPDLARLGRAWKRRIEADRELSRRAEILARGKGDNSNAAPPAVRVEPAKLAPSPHARLLPAPAPPPAPAPAPPQKKAPAVPPAISGTALALDVPRGPALPFVEAPDDDKPRAAISGTALALDVPRGPHLPFASAPRAALSGTSLLVPIPRELVQKPAPPPPRDASPKLSLEEHAALTVELAMAPARAADLLAKYRITQAEREALDRHYQAIVGADERRRAAWHEAYRAHHARIAGSFGPR